MPQVSLSEFADRMGEFLPMVMKEFGRRVIEIYKGKITLPQILIMEFLNKRGESKMTDIAQFMGVTTAAMTGIIDRLVKSGYVIRSHEPGDRRIVMIKPTAKGAGLAKKVHTQRKQMIMNIFGTISEKDRQDYLRIITQIHDNLVKGSHDA